MILQYNKQIYKNFKLKHCSILTFKSFCSTYDINKLRNIGISAHIDSGKTTLTERFLYYTGKIHEIHEVKGRDGIGAKMDSMELEREKGITIRSAATHINWKNHHINIIDTPGHVDFTIEVERSMRVLDGAILILCAVSGVQSQSYTVIKQMMRYNVPRIAFINKLDRQGANIYNVTSSLKKKLKLNAALLQIPIGTEKNLKGVIDLIREKAIYFEGDEGKIVREDEIPENLIKIVKEKRKELIENISEIDPILEEKYLLEEEPTTQELIDGIRRNTISQKFLPVFVGSAIKNKGVQPLLDAAIDYLPNPTEIDNIALDLKSESKTEKIKIIPEINKPLISLAFKLEESSYGQLTWIRVYQGMLRKNQLIFDPLNKNRKSIKVSRLVRLHSDEYKELDEVCAGDIAALFGIECNSGTTFGDKSKRYSLNSIKVPDPVISLAIKVKNTQNTTKFAKALKRFTREDPTFKLTYDNGTCETIISGMGELHLGIYVERLKREYNTETIVSPPRVNYKEIITRKSKFNYLHKKQTGGAGQFARVIGYIEPLEKTHPKYPVGFEFKNKLKGLNIPPEYVDSIRKGFLLSMNRGPLIGSPLQGVRFVIEDGEAHDVDSSDWAFQQATHGAIREAMKNSKVLILEPIMKLDASVPIQFQGALVAGLNRRCASIHDVQRYDENVILKGEVPLENMFGYSTEIRGCSQGKGEFSMEYIRHDPVPSNKQKNLINKNNK